MRYARSWISSHPLITLSAAALVADWVEYNAGLSGADITVERVSVDDGDHIIVRAFPGEGRPTLLLGHTDTVHPLGANKKNPTRIDGDRFYGCGIFDMKANIVLAIAAIRYLAAHGERPAGPITILLSCDEEVGSNSGRELVEREASKSKRCLVLEPSAGGKVKTGRKGTGMYTLRTHGVPAHAGLEPEKGANAIVELSRHFDAIHQISDPEGGTTVNVTTIKGGTTTNVIPEFAECQIDARFSRNGRRRADRFVAQIVRIHRRARLAGTARRHQPPAARTNRCRC